MRPISNRETKEKGCGGVSRRNHEKTGLLIIIIIIADSTNTREKFISFIL